MTQNHTSRAEINLWEWLPLAFFAGSFATQTRESFFLKTYLCLKVGIFLRRVEISKLTFHKKGKYIDVKRLDSIFFPVDVLNHLSFLFSLKEKVKNT